jgi:hypothetical protein
MESMLADDDLVFAAEQTFLDIDRDEAQSANPTAHAKMLPANVETPRGEPRGASPGRERRSNLKR